MKHRTYWLCAAIAAAVAVGVFYFYGLSLATFVIVLLVLICPVLVVWLTLRIARRSEFEKNPQRFIRGQAHHHGGCC